MSRIPGGPPGLDPPERISGSHHHLSPTSTLSDHTHSYPDPSQYQASATFATPHHGALQQQEQQQYLQNPPESRPSSTAQAEAHSRLRKACDSCSVRKVKCDESGPPCRSCAALDIPCTFNRPSRRRGPPNRHAEAIKRQRVESTQLTQRYSSASPDEDRGAVPKLSAESICPLPTLELLVDDYFAYIHPLIPLPHEPTFRMQLRRRDDLSDGVFLALLASMIAALVASFPRRPRQLLASEAMQKQFPSAGALIKVCHRVSAEARGPGYLWKTLTMYDSLCSYLTGISLGYTYEYRKARLHFGEAILILRNLNLHRPPEPKAAAVPFESRWVAPHVQVPEQINYVEQEMGRRLFWIQYVSNQHLRQLGSGDAVLLMPPVTSANPPPPLPLLVDDAYISPLHISEQPAGYVSRMVGFVVNVNIYRSYDPLIVLDVAGGFDEFNTIERQKRIIMDCLRTVKHATDSLPLELRLNATTMDDWPSVQNPDYHGHRESIWSEGSPNVPRGYPAAAFSKRRIQFEVQKANIYASQLNNRSFLVERYWSLCEMEDQMKPQGSVNLNQDPALLPPNYHLHQTRGVQSNNLPDADSMEVAHERDDIVRDLAVLLASINQVSMEPNGISFVNKIRAIASTLLNREGPATSTLDYESVQQYLSGFVEILVKLERLGPGLVDMASPGSSEGGHWGQSNLGLTTEEIEERELVQWASLKEHQEKFTRESGFLKNL